MNVIPPILLSDDLMNYWMTTAAGRLSKHRNQGIIEQPNSIIWDIFYRLSGDAGS